ncbi:MAG: DUF2062 domain-containing protein [Gammaproteobacteria bacterium]|nr:DUF2062 domain-containing protein [Gammaproteobacteria bacterium]
MRRLMTARWIDPLRRVLQQGVSAEELALSVALGVVIGNIPVLGVSTALCVAIAVRFRLNLAAIQLAQAAMAPTQWLLLLPFLRFGEWLTRSPSVPLSVRAGRALFAAGAGHATAALGLATLQAALAWLLVAPVAVFALYRLLRPVFARATAGRLRGGGASHPDL